MQILRSTVLLVIVVRAATRALQSRKKRSRVAHADDLEYPVQAGQDPATILGALRIAGFTARYENRNGERTVVVACDLPRDREPVRSVVRENTTRPDGQPGAPSIVSFADE